MHGTFCLFPQPKVKGSFLNIKPCIQGCQGETDFFPRNVNVASSQYENRLPWDWCS